MEKLRTLDLFSGIGGFSLGLDSTGYFETVAFCEIEEFPCKVLNKHWPNVPIYKDVRELSYEKLQADGLISGGRGIDVICGGYPCQPFSVAGRQKGEEDPRHLWPEYFRLVKELRPSYVIGENVGGHIRLGLDSVLEDLDSENYTVRCFSVEAASLGAPHRRERIFWIAVSDAQFKGLEGRSRDNRGGGREVLSGIEHDGHSVRRQARRTGGEDGGTTNDVSDTQSERRGGRNRGGRRAEQWELLKKEQEGRTLGREAERCSELPRQEGEGGTEFVSDASSSRSSGKSERDSGSMGKKGRKEKGRGHQPTVCSETRRADVADASSNGRDAKRTDQETRGTLGGSEEGRMLESEGSGSRSEVSGTEHVADAIGKQNNRKRKPNEPGRDPVGRHSETAQRKERETSADSFDRLSEDVADAQSQLGERSESEGNQRGQSETAPGDRSGDTTDATDAQTKGLEGRDLGTAFENKRSEPGDIASESHDRAEERGETTFESYLGGGNDGVSAWLDGSWERGIPRVAPSNKMRVPRLKALGNAVLPQLVYMVGMTIVLSTKRSENEEE